MTMISTEGILVLVLVTHFRFVYGANQSVIKDSSSIANSFTLDSRVSLNQNTRNSGGVSSIPAVVPSISYEFHTNDHEHLDGIVLAHQNSNDPVHNGVSAIVSSSGSNSNSNAVNLETLSSPNTATRRQDTYSALSNPYVHGVSSTPQSYTPYYNHEWRVDYSNNNGDFQSKQPLQQQRQNLAMSSSPQALPLTTATATSLVKRVPVDYRNNKNGVSSLKRENQHRGNVASASAGQHRQRPTPNVLRRRNSVRRWNNTSSAPLYTRPHDAHRRTGNTNTISHYQGRQLHTTADSMNNPNISHVYSQPMSMSGKQKLDASLHRNPLGKKSQGKRKILTSRADNYHPQYEEMDDDDGDNEADDDHINYENGDHYHEHYSGNDGDDQDDIENNEYYYGQPDHPALLRDIPQGGAGFGQGGEGGPGIPGPLPPPPVPVKGSIDYILIPLILIGLAGPIFVVLYVVLGAFEFKIAPIARSLNEGYTEYQNHDFLHASRIPELLERRSEFRQKFGQNQQDQDQLSKV